MFRWAGLRGTAALTAICTEHAHEFPALRNYLDLLQYADWQGKTFSID